jgi:hypothetical protein
MGHSFPQTGDHSQTSRLDEPIFNFRRLKWGTDAIRQRYGCGAAQRTTTMGNISRFGLLTCAGLYFAIGLFGVVFFGVQQNLSLQQNSASAADGYGIIHIAAQSSAPTTTRPGF